MNLFDGVGTDSVDPLIALCEMSGLLGRLPLLFITSSRRDEPVPFHGKHNAIDLGNNADQERGSPEMDKFARWAEENLGPYCLELIHVYQDGSTAEWKYGVKQPRGWYDGLAGWPHESQLGGTLLQHRGHVHLAMTLEGIRQARAAIEEKIRAYLTAVAASQPRPEVTYPIGSKLPDITAHDRTHPKAQALWRSLVKRINPAADVSTDRAAALATEQLRAYFRVKDDRPGRIGPAMWEAALYLSTLEKK